jgi:glycerol-3-phosphate acyltransferase PlsY
LISLAAIVLISYLIGSIPFSYIAGKLKQGIDLRQHGSGNLGASNAFRLLGARTASLVLLGDLAKGFLPVFFAAAIDWQHTVDPLWLGLSAALFAVLGHMYSIYLKFTGGKGIATTAGAFLALMPWASLIAFALWAVVLAAKKMVSLASLAAAVALPFIVYGTGRLELAEFHWELVYLAIVVSIVVIVGHRSNIRRLLRGSEPVLERKK